MYFENQEKLPVIMILQVKTKKRAGELVKRRKLHGRFLQTVLVSPLVWAWEICSLLLTHLPLVMNIIILVVNFSNMALGR
jgi:hypothetical protein